MNSMNPANVPPVDDPRWIYAVNRECSVKQQDELSERLRWEGVQAAELFGEGFSSIQELSSYAAHWGIELLISRAGARYVEEQRQMIEDYKQQQVKSMIADVLRQNNPNLRRGYVFE